MRLTDLRPRWITDSSNRSGMGMGFQCPHCHNVRLVVWFSNPVDGGPMYRLEQMPQIPHGASPEVVQQIVRKQKLTKMANCRWFRTGENYASMTLSPSIDASEAGHWHGFISNGEIVGGEIKPITKPL